MWEVKARNERGRQVMIGMHEKRRVSRDTADRERLVLGIAITLALAFLAVTSTIF